MSTCQPADTLVKEGLCVESNRVPIDKVKHRRIVGRLMYLAHIKSYMAYAISTVSQLMHNPWEQHMNAIKRISRYLKASPENGILLPKST